jgi:hypothetical protein
MNKKIKISHEVPFCLLEDSLKFNNYQYALVHLLDQNEEYADFFKRYKQNGGYIIMDNSLHELGEAYSSDRLWHWIKELEPDEFIIPDVWEDKDTSIINTRKWSKINLPRGVEKIAVVQAKDIYEAATCYQIYRDLGYKKIAFSYGASYYNKLIFHKNKDLSKALGRFSVISYLYKIGVISDNDKIHLLGTAYPQEFSWYKGFNFIDSIDTSNPIMATIDKKRYNDWGLDNKPKSNMNSCYNIPYENIDMELLYFNINKFKQINNF